MEIKISDSSFCILFFRKCHYPFLSLYPQILKNGLYEKTVLKQESGHIVWLDIVRLVAMFAVVCIARILSIFIQARRPKSVKLSFGERLMGRCFVPVCRCSL